MKKIKLLAKDENVQAGLVIAGFVLVFSLLALFFWVSSTTKNLLTKFIF